MKFFATALLCLLVLSIYPRPCCGIYEGSRVLKDNILKSYVHFGTYPHKSKDFLCGGILITWAHVLTSATCDIDPLDHFAFIGGEKLFSSKTPYISAIRTVEPYKHFNRLNGDEDLALVELRNPSRTAMKERGISPINIYWRAGHLPVGTDMFVFGFGYNKECDREEEGCEFAHTMRMAKVVLQENRKCQKSYSHVNDDKRLAMCFTGRKSTACKGDFGGPVLTYKANDDTGEPELQLAAIMSVVAHRDADDSKTCHPGAPIVGMGLQGIRSWLRHKTERFARW